MSVNTKISSFEEDHNKISAFCEKLWYERCLELTQENEHLKKANENLWCENQQLKWIHNTNSLLSEFI